MLDYASLSFLVPSSHGWVLGDSEIIPQLVTSSFSVENLTNE
jgi:hypothetical protein